MSQSPAEAPNSSLQLGTFLGVFTPTILTILGVIMFLRLGWVVSNAGIVGTLLIVVIANAITAITALSMSSLATNMRVGVGGAYYIISRSVGLELGGAVGIPLYLSQTLSLTLYSFGLAESMRIVWPQAPVQWLAAAFVVLVTLVAARSTSLALKLQIPILALIALSLAMLFFGDHSTVVDTPMLGSFEQASFWTVFAVFFPAVTGVLAGVSLSGDLADPTRSIPRGVLAAVLLGFAVYITVPFVLIHSASRADLATKQLIWTQVALVGWLVVPGLWGAILSSAFGSILSAPRTLQALATDRLAPRFLARTDPKLGEPVLGLRISGAIALVAVLLGDLNAVAEWVTVFFLTTYAALNAVALFESWAGDPSFRPRIRIPWWLSLLGVMGCGVAMFAINPLAFFLALSFELLLGWRLSRRSLQATWGDVRSGLWMSTARFALTHLRDARSDPRNWRPHLLVFAAEIERNIPRIRLADAFGQHRGIVTVASLVTGDLEDQVRLDQRTLRNDRLLEQDGLYAFCEIDAVPDIDAGMITVAQANGIAGLESNTVLLGWPENDAARLARLLGVSRKLERLGKSILIHRSVRPLSRRRNKTVDIWWRGRQHNGDLMLLLAHLLTASSDWEGTTVRLNGVVPGEELEERKAEFSTMLQEIRIEAEVNVIEADPEVAIGEVIRKTSGSSDLVLLGMNHVARNQEDQAAQALIRLLEGLPDVLLVRNAGIFRGRLV